MGDDIKDGMMTVHTVVIPGEMVIEMLAIDNKTVTGKGVGYAKTATLAGENNRMTAK